MHSIHGRMKWKKGEPGWRVDRTPSEMKATWVHKGGLSKKHLFGSGSNIRLLRYSYGVKNEKERMYSRRFSWGIAFDIASNSEIVKTLQESTANARDFAPTNHLRGFVAKNATLL
jgi:hypothetical protein